MIKEMIKEIHDYVIFEMQGNNLLQCKFEFCNFNKKINNVNVIKVPMFCDLELYPEYVNIFDHETGTEVQVHYQTTQEELFQLSTTDNTFELDVDMLKELWYIKRKLIGY